MGERRRLRLFVLVLFGLGLLIVGRLFQISILRHEHYVALAERRQNVEHDIQPRRGTVFVQDRAAGKTVAVAESIERFAMSATPNQVKNKEVFARVVSELADVEYDKLLTGLNRDSLYMPPFVRDLSQSDVERIAATLSDIQKDLTNGFFRGKEINFDTDQGDILPLFNGFFFIRDYRRVYPEGSLLSQVMGFVDDNGKGQYGFEGQFDEALRGYGGRVRLQRDSANRVLGAAGALSGSDGNSYELTIDRNVQHFAEQALNEAVETAEAESGTVIVIDPQNGEIVAMASSPGYDPNDFRAAANQDIGLFDNAAISKQWEPGSIFKPLVMAAAIDQGVVTSKTKETFGASVTVDDYTINTALRKAFGEETMTDVLTNSDNVAMVWLADKMGNQMIADYLERYGFGKRTGVELRNEITGRVIPLNQWRPINRATISFGQGIAVTPLQVASAYTAIGNLQGELRMPRLVKAVIRPDGTREEIAPQPGTPVLKPATAAEVRTMLASVVVKGYRRAQVEGYLLGGKTGTAQVPDFQKGGYLEGVFNHSFVGMGPIENPQFIVLTKIDRPNIQKTGQFAESTAVPLFQKVANFLLHYYQIKPTNL